MESLNCPSDYHKRLVVVKKRLLNGPSLLLRDEILFQYQTQKPLVALENTHSRVFEREKEKESRNNFKLETLLIFKKQDVLQRFPL